MKIKNSKLKKQFYIAILTMLIFTSALFLANSVLGQTTNRIYLIGNSVTDVINYDGLKAIAESNGNTHIWARHMIPGAPLSWLWDNRYDGFSVAPYGFPPDAFVNYTWDAISLQPFDRGIEGSGNDLEMVGNYVNLAIGTSPNVQFYIYSRWPRTPDGKSPTDVTLTADAWNNLWLRPFPGGGANDNETKNYFEDLLLACRTTHTNTKPILIIPVGDVFYALNNRMNNGLIPGYTKIWQIYTDGIHLNNIGSYITGLTFYSTMYKADPRGTAVPAAYGSIPNDIAAAIQQAVWDVVSTYQYSGVSGVNVPVTGVGINVSTLSLTNGTTSQLVANITPANATNKSIQWTSSNNLVATVNSTGLVSAKGIGTATISAITADGSFSAICTTTVTANASGETISGILANWDYAGLGGQASAAGANLLAGIASATSGFGAGLYPINFLDNGLTACSNTSSSLAQAITNNNYISFVINPTSNYGLSVSKIVLRAVSQNRTRTYSLLSSVNGYNENSVIYSFDEFSIGNATPQTVNLTGHSVVSMPIEFRLYMYCSEPNPYEAVGVGNATGIDVEISGSVTASDLQAPIPASNLTAANIKDNRFELTWTDATDNVGVVGYDVFDGNSKKNTNLITNSSFLVTGLNACTNHSITVVAYDASGNSSTSSVLVTKTNCAPTAVLNALPISGTAPLTVSFNTTGSSDPDAGDYILGFEWDFGDGSAKNNSNAPSHIYSVAGTYTVSLRVMDNRDLYSSMVTSTINVTAAPVTDGKVLREVWNGIGGTSVNLIPTLTAPNTTNEINSIEGPTNVSDDYGTRIRGYIVPTTTGSYTFYIAGDDNSQLFLSTDNTPANKTKIAEIVTWSNSREWTRETTQTSAPKALIAGQFYYFEVLHKEGGGGDNVAVGWTGPGINTVSIIGGANISSYIQEEEVDTQSPTAPSGLMASNLTQTSFTLAWNASVDNVGVLGYEVFINGVTVGTTIGTATTLDIVNLTPNTSYNMTVRANDAKGNVSVLSSELIVSTSAPITFRDPENPAHTLAGIEYNIYDGNFTILPNFGTLTPTSTGNLDNFTISSKANSDNFAFKFNGFISVPTDGIYTFYTTSDDGSKLYIGTNEVVNNDGLHGSIERSGTIGLKAGLHAIEIQFFERAGDEVLTVSYSGPGIVKTTIPNTALFRIDNTPIITGEVVMEYWNDILGTAISDIPVNATPTGTLVLNSLVSSTNMRDYYGLRIRGYIVPTTTGDYIFRISGDDNAELRLSTDENPLNVSRIAYVADWTSPLEWNKEPNQTSTAIHLVENTKYYFEALLKEGAGGDNLAIGWTGPGISTISIIPAENIARFEGSFVGDEVKPTAPTNLLVSNISQFGCLLTWFASTDNIGVTGYNIYRNGTTLVGTTSGTSYNVNNLSCNSSYSFTVKAKDAAGNLSVASNAISITTSECNYSDLPKLPIGMNIAGVNYYNSGICFTDVMSTASTMGTFDNRGAWNSDLLDRIPRDVNGYPLQIPYNVDGYDQKVRILINNFYKGRYFLLYDGVGTITINGAANGTINGKQYLDLTGQGGHVWLDIQYSQAGNYIRNLHILPEEYADGSPYPTFLPKFLDGLRPFHAFRFMDWINTNNSAQKYWSERVTKSYYSQSGPHGISFDYAIDLCNELDADAWVCIPHLADDDYIRQCARLFRDNLKPGLKVYLEFSNELWNWMFSQAIGILNNLPDHPNSYVSSDLAAIAPSGSDHPEKDAYMMARVFRIWKEEFTGVNASRLVRVAGVQQGWWDNTGRVLDYLFNVAGTGCDMVSPSGYFGFETAQHEQWLAACEAGQTVDPGEICQTVIDAYGDNYATQQNANFANQYGVGYVVYEGGQHMQPYMQSNWCYNQSLWDAQIHPKMYDLYMKNFRKHVEPDVNCQLFVAFSYITPRESQWGSWGHLESLDQIGVSNYMATAPKYQALLDANLPKTKASSQNMTNNQKSPLNSKIENMNSRVSIYPNPIVNEDLRIILNDFDTDKDIFVKISDINGKTVYNASLKSNNPVNQTLTVDKQYFNSGIYILNVTSEKTISTTKFVVQ